MSIHVQQDGERVQLRIQGELNIYCASDSKAQLLDALSAGRELEVDLSDLEELDTAGVQLMLMLKQEAQRGGRQCSFINHSPAVRDVIDLLNLASALGDPVVIPA